MRKDGSKPTDEIRNANLELLGVIIACIIVLGLARMYEMYRKTLPAKSCIGIELNEFLRRLDTSCFVGEGEEFVVRLEGGRTLVDRIQKTEEWNQEWLNSPKKDSKKR